MVSVAKLKIGSLPHYGLSPLNAPTSLINNPSLIRRAPSEARRKKFEIKEKVWEIVSLTHTRHFMFSTIHTQGITIGNTGYPLQRPSKVRQENLRLFKEKHPISLLPVRLSKEAKTF